MKFRGLDAAGDWMYGQGSGSYAKEKAALLLSIATRLRMMWANCFFAPNSGIDYINRMNPGRAVDLQQDIIATIRGTDGVVGISDVSFDVDLRARRLSLRALRVETVYGQAYLATLDVFAGATNA
jgi:hypothetical protein